VFHLSDWRCTEPQTLKNDNEALGSVKADNFIDQQARPSTSTYLAAWSFHWLLRVRARARVWVRVCVCVCEWLSECVSEWVSEWVCEWMSECECTRICFYLVIIIHEWNNSCSSDLLHCVCMRVWHVAIWRILCHLSGKIKPNLELLKWDSSWNLYYMLHTLILLLLLQGIVSVGLMSSWNTRAELIISRPTRSM